MAIKPELEFGLDNFGKQKKMNEKDTISQMLINLFLLRPGQLPSLPHVGIDIRQYLYQFEDVVNAEAIREKIVYQCMPLTEYIYLDSIQVVFIPYEQETLMYIVVPIRTSVDNGGTIIYGFKKQKKSNIVTFNYKVTDEQLM